MSDNESQQELHGAEANIIPAENGSREQENAPKIEEHALSIDFHRGALISHQRHPNFVYHSIGRCLIIGPAQVLQPQKARGLRYLHRNVNLNHIYA